MNGREKVDICKACGRTIGSSEKAIVIKGRALSTSAETGINELSASKKGRTVMKTVLVLIAAIFLVTSAQNASGQIVSSTGKQEIKSVIPEGQFIGFRYEVGGKMLMCGIRVRSLVFEQKFDGTGPDAKAFLFIHDLELVKNNLEYAYSENDPNKTVSGETEFKDVDFSTGHILLTVPKLPFSPPDSRYKLTLTDYFKGTMQLLKEKPGTQEDKKRETQLTGEVEAEDISFADGGRRVIVAKGTGTIKTEDGQLVASGDLVITKDDMLALKGKEGASFKHTPSVKTLPIKWAKSAPDLVSTVQFDGNETWTLKDGNFLFYLEFGSDFRAKVLVDQSLFQSSRLIFPEGRFSLMDYLVTCGSGGGTVVFKAGKAVDGQNIVVETADKKRIEFPQKTREEKSVDAEKYEKMDPAELSFELKGYSQESVVTPEGPKTVGGTVEEFLCEGKKIELASNKFEGEFLITKEYGNIKIQFSPSLTSSGFSVWLTPKQKEALKSLKDQATGR